MMREMLDKYIEILEQQTALFGDDEYEEGMEAIRELKALALRATDLSEKYEELIMAVAKKHPGETRHETALRYIQQAEEGSDQNEAAQEDQP